MSVIGQARAWIADDVDPDAAAELTTLTDAAEGGDAGAAAELADRFAAALTFGTAGLRGPLRAGPNGMNRTVVRRTSAGIAAWLTERGGNLGGNPGGSAGSNPGGSAGSDAGGNPLGSAGGNAGGDAGSNAGGDAGSNPGAGGNAGAGAGSNPGAGAGGGGGGNLGSKPGGDAGAVIVIGHDARHGSAVFAADSAGVFAAAGFDVRLLPGEVPTPVLAFAVKALGAEIGVMVTASHNPARDNGYKVYGADGAQIVPPTDGQIEAAIRALGPSRDIARSDRFTRLDQAIVEAYVEAVAGLVSAPARPIRIVHTAMHGVGTSVLAQVFMRAGYARPIPVPEQAEPDPDFPTVAFPNPEEKGALDLALALARAQSADLLVASDPDADRCAIAVEFPSPDGPHWRALTGDELGALLADHLMRAGRKGTYATTIVSSTLLAKMARRRGFPYVATLTGFKWITRAAADLAFGYEEALGYAVAPGLVRDKDGISAGLLAADLTARLRADGSSIPQRLEEIATEFGRHTTGQISIRVDDLGRIDDTMRRLRAQPPAELRGRGVTVTDLSPAADVLTFAYAGGRVVVRPSGTEPKLKAYLEVVSTADAASAATELKRLQSEVSALLGV